MNTFQALGVTLVAILPGASYMFAYERVAGGFGVSLADRLFRFLAASAVFAALFFGPGLVIYRDVVVTGQLARGELAVWPTWAIVIVYVAIPTAVGSGLGSAHKAGNRWARILLGEAPEPRAWDHLWRREPQGVVRMRLTSGTWLAGIYGTWSGRKAYAAGYPESGDIFLPLQVMVDAESGELQSDDDGCVVPVAGGGGLLVRWEQVEFLEIQETNNG